MRRKRLNGRSQENPTEIWIVGVFPALTAFRLFAFSHSRSSTDSKLFLRLSGPSVMSEDVNGKDYRPQRRHSIERYRPGARNRQDEDYGEDLSEQLGGMSIREDKGRGRGRGKLPLAPRDLRNKLNEIRKNAPPLDQHHYINSNNINIHSNYHRNNNHHRNDNRYHYPKGRGKQGQQNEDRREDASGSLPLVTRNTECFEPSYEPPDMRILFAQPDWKNMNENALLVM
ncbi:unnamed protein product [Lepeophtheirus salmonis]|uniref:(salmon louse) hypothetical protein n=1 Tax=Lepeophtheirus salmonis TaxID=72036 RepID=A0A7R8CET3_LEPSM|nr:unnamed protein product [Lepeophtheirus salmonis]CAF2794327.1 unnamed protein product [Lepeophtheirus salmonis]